MSLKRAQPDRLMPETPAVLDATAGVFRYAAQSESE